MNEIIEYRELLNIKVEDNGEKMMSLTGTGIRYGCVDYTKDLFEDLGGDILLREGTLSRLLVADDLLKSYNPNYYLYVLEGYRPLSVQIDRFLTRLRELGVYYDDPFDLYQKVHESVAVPNVAGHPTGGAVDVLIWNEAEKSFLDFGSEIYNYEDDLFVFNSKGLKEAEFENRSLLRSVMVKAGFYSFDGEYWHFSYGDREWAVGCKQQRAIYDQLDLEVK